MRSTGFSAALPYSSLTSDQVESAAAVIDIHHIKPRIDLDLLREHCGGLIALLRLPGGGPQAADGGGL